MDGDTWISFFAQIPIFSSLVWIGSWYIATVYRYGLPSVAHAWSFPHLHGLLDAIALTLFMAVASVGAVALAALMYALCVIAVLYRGKILLVSFGVVILAILIIDGGAAFAIAGYHQPLLSLGRWSLYGSVASGYILGSGVLRSMPDDMSTMSLLPGKGEWGRWLYALVISGLIVAGAIFISAM